MIYVEGHAIGSLGSMQRCIWCSPVGRIVRGGVYAQEVPNHMLSKWRPFTELEPTHERWLHR